MICGTISVEKKRLLLCHLMALVGGVIVQIAFLGFANEVSIWAGNDVDGTVLPFFLAGILLSIFYIPARPILKTKDAWLWTILISSFAGMVIVLQVLGIMSKGLLLYSGGILLVATLMTTFIVDPEGNV